MAESCTVVLTAKSVERILEEGGTSSWRLDRNHARQCPYSVCTRNANADWTEGSEAHHSAFLIGQVSDVVPSTDYEGRYLIKFSEFARVDIPNVWKGDRNPIRYSTLEELGIDSSGLHWEPMPSPKEHSKSRGIRPLAGTVPLTMAAAKEGLALTFGVTPDAIEITIRG
jgi:hypothetical protein